MKVIPITTLLSVFATASIGLPSPVAAQQSSSTTVRRLLVSRAELEQRRDQLRQAAQPGHPTGSPGEELSDVEARLEGGDFHLGDRVAIQVEDLMPGEPVAGAGSKSVEQQLTDTFTVNAAQALALPLLGPVPLRGVLRSELEQYLKTQIATRLRDPQVRARALIPVVVSGGVVRPGYFYVPADALVAAVITAAGGGNKDAKMTDVRIIRDGKIKWKGQALQRAIAEGRTLDELEVQPGDEIAVAQRGSVGDGLRLAAVILSIPVAILTISRF